MPDQKIPIKRALLSVSDKTGLADFAKKLVAQGVELISTGGTAKHLKKSNIACRDISDLTDWPEMMDGRVKTLHPTIHGGLLARRDNAAHRADMQAHNIAEIDLLVANLYPFEEISRNGGDYAACIEQIDIGGPAMIRAAAKNHAFVAVAIEPQDYPTILEANAEGGTDYPLRQQLAQKAFARSAVYDAAISNWMAHALGIETPPYRIFGGQLKQILRYGENPHQQAAFYVGGAPRPGVATARQVQGKELSYNNINDAFAAYELVAEFDAPACVIVKHANPCGVALADNLADAFEKALACDSVSAFGGIVAVNQPLDDAAARTITQIFTEVIIAPQATRGAQNIIAAKKNLRLLVTDKLPDPRQDGFAWRQIGGGFLVQSRNAATTGEIKCVTQRAPSTAEMEDLLFAWVVAKHAASNAIVFANGKTTCGIGAGQMSRLDSVHIAAKKMREAAPTKNAVVASDAFFPFPDALLAAAEAGATAVIQPGGSMRDKKIIAAADEVGLAMVFTGIRHFRH